MRILTKKRGFTLVELLVVIAIIGILIGMLLPAVQSVREAARRIQCGNNMKQLSLSMHNFESANMRFPPGTKTNDEGTATFATHWNQRSLNWHVFVLPFIEQAPLADIIDGLPERFEATTNPLCQTLISNLTCPSCPMEDINEIRPAGNNNPQQAKSNYVGVWGIEVNGNSDYDDFTSTPSVLDPSVYSGILFIDSRTGFGEITDGTSNTFVIAERDGAPIGASAVIRAAATWCGGQRASWTNQCCAPISGQLDYFINTVEDNNAAKWNAISSQHTGGANFGRADGSVAFVADTINIDTYEALGTKSGGEVNVSF